MRRRFRLTTFILAAGLLIACGGSDDAEPDGGNDGDDGGGGNGAATATAAPATAEPDSDTPDLDGNSGTMTLDGETYHFEIEDDRSCDPDYLNGLGFRATLIGVDESGNLMTAVEQSLLVTLAREEAGGEGSVVATVDSVGWQSGLDGTTTVEFTIDGNQAEGSGTFVTSDGRGPVDGSFAVTCAG